MSLFDNHCHEIVKEYVQTVLIIDDGAGLEQKVVEEPRVLDEPLETFNPLENNSFLESYVNETNECSEQIIQDSHSLNTLDLTNSFFELGIIAGIFQPQIVNDDEPTEFAKKVNPVIATADIIILDWMLKRHDARFSMSIVKQILEQDKKSGGRLRTIIIYTGESDLPSIKNQLYNYLSDSSLNDNSDFEIKSDNLNIVFYNKVGTLNARRLISEKDLSLKALDEFKSLIDGLVPAFAMKTASSIRQNTGKILARFGSELDIGYLSHRVLLPDVNDSEVFMLDSFVSYLRSLISISQVDRDTLGEKAIESWVEKNFTNLVSTINYNGVSYNISKSGIKTLAKFGFAKKLKCVISDVSNDSVAESFNDSTKPCFEKAISIFDFKSGHTSQHSSVELSILTSFRRTFNDICHSNKPYLTQGSLIYSVKDNRFLLCVTPRCDTARVEGSATFSFAVLERKLIDKKFDLIAPIMSEVSDLIRKPLIDERSQLWNSIIERELSNTGKTKMHADHKRLEEISELLEFDDKLYLSTPDKFHLLQHIVFSSDNNCRVNPNMTALDNLAFWDDDVNEYIWIGDLQNLEAQRRVSNFVKNLNRVGIDEVEWLRRKYQ